MTEKTTREESLWDRFWLGPWWWLVPLAALLVPALLIFRWLQPESVAMPFVYTVF